MSRVKKYYGCVPLGGGVRFRTGSVRYGVYDDRFMCLVFDGRTGEHVVSTEKVHTREFCILRGGLGGYDEDDGGGVEQGRLDPGVRCKNGGFGRKDMRRGRLGRVRSHMISALP